MNSQSEASEFCVKPVRKQENFNIQNQEIALIRFCSKEPIVESEIKRLG